ncbi:MAG: septal ring lytic transglycosylase RlpA family protein [Alphaproteobacteria bacterium]|nr:septal ring lytic transglycosylase RlpA family protein [Alphaproteobacteria bacterium]
MTTETPASSISFRWSTYRGAIGAVIVAVLVVAVGVAIPLQMIPPKKEEAVAMIAPPPQRPPEYGVASWYGDHEAGLRTASGALFRPDALTAAHRWLPLGTKVKVTRLGTQRSTVVTINDRGPFIGGRLIDLSPAAARQLAIVDKGVARVRVDILEVPPKAQESREARHSKKRGKAKTEELANQPEPPSAAAAASEAAKPTPAEAAQQAKPIEAKPAAAAPDSNTHFP